MSWRSLLLGGGAFVALTLLCFLVGHFASRPRTGYFDWELASIFGTAVGTTALAVATMTLVLATGRLAAQGSAEVRALDRPVLLLEQYTDAEVMSLGGGGGSVQVGTTTVAGIHLGDGGVAISIRNVGKGPALNIQSELFVSGGIEVADPTLIGLALPVGGKWAIAWSGLPEDTLCGRGQIRYKDVSGFGYLTAFVVRAKQPGPGIVEHQEFRIDEDSW
jgi:hypothetical protein